MTKMYEVILLAAGSSRRLNEENGKNKILKVLNNRPVFDYALRLFLEDTRCQRVWFVMKPEEKETIQEELRLLYDTFPYKIKWVSGGEERQDSVQKALGKMDDRENTILIHDAARPFIQRKLINNLLEVVGEVGAVSLGLPATDSMKLVKESLVEASLYRPSVWHIQTPQAFSKALIKRAMAQAMSEEFYGNEEGELVERLGHQVKVIRGSKQNFKITTSYDYKVATILAKEMN